MRKLVCIRLLCIFLFVLLSQTHFAAAQEKSPAAAKSAEAKIAVTKPESVTNSLGMQLVLIPAGEYMMGGGESGEELVKQFPQYELKADFFYDEFPQHRVRITKPFYYGKHEVTNAQFREFVNAKNYVTEAERPEESRRGPGGWGFNQEKQTFEGRDPKYNWKNPGFKIEDNQPVVDVTWNDANAFIDWLSTKEGKKYRLPTEAEFEYCARAGTKTRYSTGDDPDALAKVANTADADFHAAYPTYYPANKTVAGHDGFKLLAPIGSFPANQFGLCDMHGNVWEWTNDWYGDDYYKKSPVDDPKGPAEGSQKIRRGGAWHTAPFFVRSAFRNINTRESRYPNWGFRVVLEK
jgi:formylglycine-generating enzyme